MKIIIKKIDQKIFDKVTAIWSIILGRGLVFRTHICNYQLGSMIIVANLQEMENIKLVDSIITEERSDIIDNERNRMLVKDNPGKYILDDGEWD